MRETRHVNVEIHGRYLYEARDPERLLVGFHGYAETAEVSLAAMQQIPGIETWSVAAVQALHPFYTREKIAASWMTALDREQAIDENIRYVQAVLASLPTPRVLVFLGFSQGASMAVRAAALASANPSGLIMLGGDIPPELDADRLPPVLLARGIRDDWYTDEKFKRDVSFLESRTRLTECVFDGGHEWTDAFREAAGKFLKRVAGS